MSICDIFSNITLRQAETENEYDLAQQELL